MNMILGTRYQSLDRGGLVDPHHEREFIPIREPRDRSRDRSLDRGLYLEDDLYGRSRQSPNPMGGEYDCLFVYSFFRGHNLKLRVYNIRRLDAI